MPDTLEVQFRRAGLARLGGMFCPKSLHMNFNIKFIQFMTLQCDITHLFALQRVTPPLLCDFSLQSEGGANTS